MIIEHPTLKTLTLDIRGNNPDNLIKDEKMEITEGCKWVIPNGAPFYIKDFELYDERGAFISPSKYKLVGEYTPIIRSLVRKQ